jgi:hypothetical protein
VSNKLVVKVSSFVEGRILPLGGSTPDKYECSELPMCMYLALYWLFNGRLFTLLSLDLRVRQLLIKDLLRIPGCMYRVAVRLSCSATSACSATTGVASICLPAHYYLLSSAIRSTDAEHEKNEVLLYAVTIGSHQKQRRRACRAALLLLLLR